MQKEALHILLFSTLFPHAAEPTLGIFVQNRLMELQKRHNVHVTVVAPVPWFPFKGKLFGKYGRAAAAPKHETQDGIEVYHPRYLVIPKIGMQLTPWFLFFCAKKMVRKLINKGARFQLIDAHYLFPDGVAAYKLSKVFGLPYTLTARGSDVTQIALLRGPQKQILEACAHANKVITVSENLKHDLETLGVTSGKLLTLRNGVDLVRFQETQRMATREAIGLKGSVMLFAGWLIPRKRLDLVLKVTKLLPDLTTVIVGDGPDLESLKAVSQQYDISERVQFLGQKKPEDMPALFSAADVLLLPSDREGWANVLLEAMACGTPVVSRAVGSAPDLITDERVGAVVDSEDPELLAKAVTDVLNKASDRSYVRLFAEKYDWTETSDGQYEVFSNAAKGQHDG